MNLIKSNHLNEFQELFIYAVTDIYYDHIEMHREQVASGLIRDVYKTLGRSPAAALVWAIDSKGDSHPKELSKKKLKQFEKVRKEFREKQEIRNRLLRTKYKGNEGDMVNSQDPEERDIVFSFLGAEINAVRHHERQEAFWKHLNTNADFLDVFDDPHIVFGDDLQLSLEDIAPGGATELLEMVIYALGGFLSKNVRPGGLNNPLLGIQSQEGFTDKEYIKRLLARCSDSLEVECRYTFLDRALTAAITRFKIDCNENLNKEELASLAGVNERAISNFFSGSKKEISSHQALSFLRSKARNRWKNEEGVLLSYGLDYLSLKLVNEVLKEKYEYLAINHCFYESSWQKQKTFMHKSLRRKNLEKEYLFIPYKIIGGKKYKFLPSIKSIKGYKLGEEKSWKENYREALKYLEKQEKPFWWHPSGKPVKWKKIVTDDWERTPLDKIEGLM